jgi:hypothetical protein
MHRHRFGFDQKIETQTRPEHPMDRILLTCISIVLLMMPILPARSDEFPVLNVQPLCHGIVSQGDAPLQTGDRAVTMDECLQAERVDRETMIKEWPQFSAADRKNCTAEATMGGESSYTDLLTCLEMARDVKQLKQSPLGTKKID